MKHKALTLAEIMIAALIFLIGVGAIFMVYPTLFEGVEITSQTMKAWTVCRKEIETLKNEPFINLTNRWNSTQVSTTLAGPITFVNTTDMRGVYYLEKLYGNITVGNNTTEQLLDDMLRADVVVCFRAKNRVIGEDQNLDGVSQSTEDLNNNTRIDSPVNLTTLILSQ